MTAVQPPAPASRPGPASAAPSGLDPAALARLSELDPSGRHGVVLRVLTAFEASLVRMLVQVAAQAEAPDAVVLTAVSHTWKSSSASVGALRLAAVCEEIERRLRPPGGTAPGVAPATAQRHDVERLLAEGEGALAAVRAMLRV